MVSLGSIISKYFDVAVYIKRGGGEIDPEKGLFSYKTSFDVMVLGQKMQIARIIYPTDYMTGQGKKNTQTATTKLLFSSHLYGIVERLTASDSIWLLVCPCRRLLHPASENGLWDY